MNLRFPGQYFDQESGFHYNYYRDYDPEVGRYVERDPMGLAGGVNLYGYVEGNPIGAIDPQGLLVIDKKACKKRQREQIEDAERKVEKAIGKICDQCKNENGCVPCRFRKRLLNNLATTIVSCERGEKCGRTDEANTKITIISPNGFNPNSYCGCLEATLLHELFHIIGVDEQYHRYINDIEVACFSCGKLLGPDYDETYGNIHDIP